MKHRSAPLFLLLVMTCLLISAIPAPALRGTADLATSAVALRATATSNFKLSNFELPFPPRPGKDYALFFAVNDYQRDAIYPDLKFPVENARRIAAELKKNYAFDTLVVVNPTRQQIKDRLEAYKKDFAANRKDREGQLLVFFTGHGVQQYGNGYFVPADANPADLEGSALQYGYWRNFINELDCKHILVALDACHSGTFDPAFGHRPGGLYGTRAGELSEGDKLRQQHANTKARLYLASGAPDQTTPDKSAFAKKFLEGLLTKGYGDGLLTSSELYVNLESATPRPLRGEFGDDVEGSSFLFFYSGSIDDTPPDPAAAAERKAWAEAKKTNTMEGYRAFLRQHPYGDFAELARDRVAALDDLAAWNEAKKVNTPEVYRDFIKRFPDSDYVDLAQKRAAIPPPDAGNPTAKSSENTALPTPPDRSSAKSGFEMVRVTGGNFTMGCKDGRDTECYDDEKPAHTVTISTFAISRYEITQADWRAVMGNAPSNFKNCDQCPVEQVSWDDIQDFIKKANAKYSSVLGGRKYRLPTEAEWEYAARGGNASGNLLYAGSKNLGDVAWYQDNSAGKTHPVGEKKSNELGLYDMSGNVWEWVEDDWHGEYKNAPTEGSAWVERGTRAGYRVLRGGSWSSVPQFCRAAVRRYGTPTIPYFHIGFRLALSF